MSITRKYFSASSGTNFSECPAKWATNYDDDRNVNSRNQWSDVGNLVHGALELWRNPENDCEKTFEELEKCFDQAATKHIFAEPMRDYARAKELLAAAFRMTQNHPTVPIQLMQTIAVEQQLVVGEGDDWEVEGWPQPARGQIDNLGIIPAPKLAANHVIVFIEDYKTGKPKTHEYLTSEDIQAPLYFYWTRDVFVPYLEAQIEPTTGDNFKVTRIIGSWSYVGDGTAVPLYESDFDHQLTHDYIQNLQSQMIAFTERYNAFMEHLADPTNGFEMTDEQAVNEWLSNYEKPNSYCGYCPRKNVCQTFQRLLKYESKVDLTGPNVSWDEIYLEYVAYQAIEKNAHSRVQEIKDIIPIYLDQERLESIPLADGMELVANPENRKRYLLDKVKDILGTEFILKNATVTDTAIKKQIDLIASGSPETARNLEAQLQGAYISYPYSRPVRARKQVVIKEKKGKK
jgi:hypothetical protein